MAHIVVWSPRAIDDVDSLPLIFRKTPSSMPHRSFELSWRRQEDFPNFRIKDVLFRSLAITLFVRSLHTVIESYIASKLKKSL